jgi:hypothetical protein
LVGAITARHEIWWDEFLRQGGYRKRIFAVADYTVNNIPEFNNLYTWHQFRTRKTGSERQALVIYEWRRPSGKN